MGLQLHKLQQRFQAGAALEFRLAKQSRHPEADGAFAAVAPGQVVAAEALPQQFAAASQLAGERLPVQATSTPLELIAGPALQGWHLGTQFLGHPQVETAGGGPLFHEQHQQPVVAWDQPDRLEAASHLLGPGDQAHQAREVGQAAGELQQQVIQGGPLQAQPRELTVELIGGGTGGGQEAVHVVAIPQLARNAAGGGVRLGEQAPLFQGSHGGAHRGWAGLEVKAPHQGLAAHGLRGVDVVLHRRLKHLLLPSGQGLQNGALMPLCGCYGA